MSKCVIIDDEQHAIDVLVRYIKELTVLELAGTSTDPLEGIELIRRYNADLVFLDIQMGRLNGIDLVRTLPKNVRVIFCTGFPEFAVEAFDVEAIDYILKPVNFNRFMRAVQRVPNLDLPDNLRVHEMRGDYIFVQAGRKGKMKKIELDKLDYIEAKSNYIALYCGDEKTMAYLSMQKIEDRLPKTMFIRIHRSFIVAIKKITAVQNNMVIIQCQNSPIPIGQSYREDFFDGLHPKLLR